MEENLDRNWDFNVDLSDVRTWDTPPSEGNVIRLAVVNRWKASRLARMDFYRRNYAGPGRKLKASTVTRVVADGKPTAVDILAALSDAALQRALTGGAK